MAELPDNFQVVVAVPVVRANLLQWLERQGWELFVVPYPPGDLPTYGVRAIDVPTPPKRKLRRRRT